MNKKVIIGCLVGFLVVAIIVGVVLYFYVIRPGMEYLAGVQEMAQVAELDKNIENQDLYTPPADELLTRDQVDRFLRVQSHMETTLGTRGEELKQKYDRFSNGQEPNFAEILQMLKDLGSLIREAKEIQVEGLNQEDFSIEEYRWVRNQIYSALGANITNLNLEKIVEAVQNQDPDILTEKPEITSIPEANRALVESHKEKLMKSLAFVWLGL
jgi:uncharacterized Zn finger protein